MLVGGTVGVSFLRQHSVAPEHPASAPEDPRLAKFVASAHKFMEAGELERAGAELSKASVLAESDPGVLTAQAQLDTIQADLAWLKLRLLDPNDKEQVDGTRRLLESRVWQVEDSVEAAVSVAGDDPAVIRARVDLYRFKGELASARKLATTLDPPSQPSNAYVLALLDLAEPQPAYHSAAERLKTASHAEGPLGRARAALVYALAQAGDIDAARAQLTTLGTANDMHPLLPELRSFVSRFAGGNHAEAGPKAEPTDTAEPGAERPDATEPDSREEVDTHDFRVRLKQANAALRGNQLDRAKSLFQAVLRDQPANSEALAGLAEVARRRNDPRAGDLYDQVLAKNPSYLPALQARADQKWDSGDRAGAVAMYERILAQAGPDSSYGRHAAARIAAQQAAAGTTRPAPTATPQPPPPAEPHIDTTDLPGLE